MKAEASVPDADQPPEDAETPLWCTDRLEQQGRCRTEQPASHHCFGLDFAVPDHITLSRRAETLQLPRPSPHRGDRPMHLLGDSTGLKLCGAGEWLLEKHGTKTRLAWRTLHIGTNVDTGHVVAATLTGSGASDASQVGPLLDQVDGPVALFTADGAYDWGGANRRGNRHHAFRQHQDHLQRPAAFGLDVRVTVVTALSALNRVLDLKRPRHVRSP